MKIAMIGHKRIPSREGGVEIVVEELATRMSECGHDITVYNRMGHHVSGKENSTKTKTKEYKGVKIKTVFTINKKGLDALIYSFFATILAIFCNYDVIHYHAEGPCAMIPIAKLFGKKVVATIHGLDWQRAKWGGFATKFLLFGEKMAAKYADEVIVLSENVKNYFKDTYNRDVKFVPNGVNKPVIRKADIITKKYGLKKDNYILFLARIVPEKGLHYLIDAYNQLNTDKKLVIAGGSSHTNTYYNEIKEKVKNNKNIIMTGFVQGKELEELFSNCYLYCLPSDIEGMPLSLLEAMSYGRNCLVSDIKENVTVCDEYAFSFKKGNVNDLKKQLEKLLSNKNLLKKEADISNHVLEKYNWDDIANKTLNIYKNIKKDNSKKQSLKNIIIYIFVMIMLMYFCRTKGIKIILYSIAYISMILFLLKHKNYEIFSIPVFFSIYHAIYIGLCPIFLYINSVITKNNINLQKIVDSQLFLNDQCIIILLSYLIFLITVILSEKIIFSKENIEKVKKEEKISYPNKFCYLMLGISFILLIIYIFKNFNYLFGGMLESGRITAMSGNGILLYGMWLGTMSLALMFESFLRKEISLKVFLPLCILYSISILTLGFRSRLVTLCILMIFIYNKYHKIKIKKTLFLGLGLVLLVCGLGVARDLLSGVENTSITKTFVNLFQNGSVNINYILEEFPLNTPFQYGKTLFINLKMLLPGPDMDFTLWLKDILNLYFDGGGVTPTILGEFYINLGYIGIALGFIIVGILVNILEKNYLYKKNTYYSVFLIWCLLSSVRGGFTNTEINFILYSIVYFVIIWIFKKLKKFQSKEGE